MVGGQPETLVLTDENGNFSLWYTNITRVSLLSVASSWGIEPKAMSFSSRTHRFLSLRELKALDNLEYISEIPELGSMQWTRTVLIAIHSLCVTFGRQEAF